jgi:molecular chaperone DnaK
VAKGDDVQAIKSAINELEQASHAFSKTLYEAAARAGGAGAAAGPSGGPSATPQDDTIDAEFEVKDN